MSHYEIQEALHWENVTEVKRLLKQHDYKDIRNINGETQLLEFLNRKLILKVNDLRLVLLLLRAGTNVDTPDCSGFTARRKLKTLGYSVDRIYLTITQNEVTRITAFANVDHAIHNMLYN